MKNLILVLFLSLSYILSSQTQKEIVDYFNKVCKGNEFNHNDTMTYKWKTDVFIYIGSDKKLPKVIDQLNQEANRVVKELNNLINTINITITKDSAKANLYLYLGSHEEFVNKFNNLKDFVEDAEAGGHIRTKSDGEIYYSYIYIDLYRTTPSINTLKHFIREEITQALGPIKDTYDYQDSIFYQGYTNYTEFSNIDREIIKMLYNK
jgi:hypothetical protein